MSNEAAHWIEPVLARYERPLIQYALGLCGGDLDQARDIVQDTFLRLTRETEPPAGNHIGPWLFTVCRNRAHDHHRKSSRITYLETPAMEDLPDEVTPQPSVLLDRKEHADALHQLIDSLPANQREVIRLKFQHDLSYREISEITTLSIGNVGFLLHTGLRRLRELLQQHEAQPERKIG
ncbi:MAG TPA: sigma-70 family RNA polymerase sigma factor [Chthoniobacterales bacterium]